MGGGRRSGGRLRAGDKRSRGRGGERLAWQLWTPAPPKRRDQPGPRVALGVQIRSDLYRLWLTESAARPG